MKFKEIPSTKRSNSTKAEFIKAAMFKRAPLLQYIDYVPIVGDAKEFAKGEAMEGVGQTRQPGQDFNADKTQSPKHVMIKLTALGDKVKTDMIYSRRGEDTVAEDYADALEEFGLNLGQYFQSQLIAGTGAGSEMTGLTKLVKKKQVFNLAENGLEIQLGTDNASKESQAALLNALDLARLSVKDGPTCIIMNTKIITLLKRIAEPKIVVERVQDYYNNTFSLTTYEGIPIVDAGYMSNNTDFVLSNNETCGDKQDCTSIYFVNYSKGKNVKVITSVGGLEVIDEGFRDNFLRTHVEFDAGQGLLDDRAIFKIAGIRY